MKSRETLIRLKKFQVDEKRRKVAQIEAMIAEFDRIAAELDREIKTEQERAGIHDPAHFAYPTYAKAAGGSEIAVGGGDLVLGLARKPGQRLLQKLDIGLQAAGAALHLLFGRADFQPANVLCGRGRQQRHEQQRCAEERCGAVLPMLTLSAAHA